MKLLSVGKVGWLVGSLVPTEDALCSILVQTTWRVVALLSVLLPFSICQFYWCHSTNSLGEPPPLSFHSATYFCPIIALSSFSYLTLFNIGR